MSEIHERIVGILFSDIVGFSQLQQHQIKIYIEEILPKLAAMISEQRENFVDINTWGDAIFITSVNAGELGRFALELRDFFRNHSWSLHGLPQLSIRISVHAAQVWMGKNPISVSNSTANTGSSCFGKHINLAARIEPIVPPNTILASREFVDIVRTDQFSNFLFDSVGSHLLPKDAGEIELWAMRRPYESSSVVQPARSVRVDPIESIEPDETKKQNRYLLGHNRLMQCTPGEIVKFIAITGKGALLPHVIPGEDFRRKPVPQAIAQGATIMAIVLDPFSAEAVFRSSIESPSTMSVDHRLLQSDAQVLAASVYDTYQRELCIERDVVEQRLRIKRTTLGIAFSLWLFDDFAVIEPHHFGRQIGQLHLCHFSQLIVPYNTREYKVLIDHFETLWTAAETVPLPKVNQPIH